MMKRLIFLLLILFPIMVQAKTITYTIQASTDDAIASTAAFENAIWVGTGTLTGNNLDGFLRFGSRIPKNATISDAHLDFVASADSAGDTGVTVKLIDADNVAAFSLTPWGGAVTGSVAWTIPALTTDAGYASANIASLITAYIGRAGYQYGYFLGLRIVYGGAGNDKRFYSFDTAGVNQKETLTVTYTGGDGIVEAWMAEPHNRVKQYVYAQIWNQDAGDKVKFYLDNSLLYTYTVQAGDVPADAATRWEKSYLYDYTGLSAGEHHIDIVLTTSADVARGTFTKTWTTTHSGYPKVGVDENNSLCIRDGGGTSCTVWFPLTAFMFGAEDGENIALYTTHAFKDTINANIMNGYCDDHNLPCLKKYLDANTTSSWRFIGLGRCDADGLSCTEDQMFNNSTDCGSGDGTGDAISTASCSMTRYFKNHAALGGYTVFDEPDLNSVPKATVQSMHTGIRTVDTDHPIYVNFYGYDYNITTSSDPAEWTYLRSDYTTMGDWVAIDYYPYEFGTATISNHTVTLQNSLGAIDRMVAWNYNLFPFGSYLEPHKEATEGAGCPSVTRPALGQPTVDQVKNMFWLAVIHGARSMPYFGPDIPSIDFGGGLVCTSSTPAANMTALAGIKTTLAANSSIITKAILAAQSTKATRQTFDVTAANGVGTVTVNLPWSAASVSGGRVDYTVREYGGKVYVIAARAYGTGENPGWPDDTNTDTVTATFALTGLNGTRAATRLLSSGTVTVTDGGFSDTFVPYGNEIYEIGETTPGTKFVPWRIP